MLIKIILFLGLAITRRQRPIPQATSSGQTGCPQKARLRKSNSGIIAGLSLIARKVASLSPTVPGPSS